MHNLLLLG